MSDRDTLRSHYLLYRLWIAALNCMLTELRILDDSIKERQAWSNGTVVKSKIEYFLQAFASIRNEIDTVKHELHLAKMKTAAILRLTDMTTKDKNEPLHPVDIESHYMAVHQKFEILKQAYLQFVANAVE